MFKKISQNFVKSPLKLCFISQILVHSLWLVGKKKKTTRAGILFFSFNVNTVLDLETFKF